MLSFCVVCFYLKCCLFILPASRQNSSKKAKGGAGGKDRNCSESFSEFDKLKAHLKASHEGSEWPWICGFCDLVLLYDLEFEVHIKQHTDKPPFGCPICSRLFSDNSKLREHLACQHLPSRDSQPSVEALTTAPTASVSSPGLSSAAQIKSKQPQLTQEQLEAFEKLRNSSMTDSLQATRRGRSQDMTADAISSSAQASNVKDEAAVSRELAALLLNLHDSNGRLGPQQSQHNSASINVPKAEDLSLKSSVETAIDLTKSKPEITLTPTMPASITKLVKGHNNSNNSSSGSNNGSSGVTVTKTSVKAPSYPASSASGGGSAAAQAQAAAASAYPFYPSLASMTSLSPTLAMNSNYLLHNLLLGKFQQIANSSNSASTASTASPASASTAAGGNGNGGAAGSTTSTTVSSQNMASLPTHPLPAQALTMPTSKPPASVLKSASSQQSATSNGTSGSRSATTSSAAAVAAANAAAAESAAAVAANAAGYSSLQLLSDTSSASASANGLDIPYMCRQIVTLLNGLLFHQHNLNNHTVEMNVHTQLGAIYTRLQEVVVMVEQAKKQQEAAKVAAATVAAVAKKEEKHLKVSLSQIIPKL